MTTHDAMRAVQIRSVAPLASGIRQPHASIGFDWTVIGLCGWFQFGVFLDGWAHHHLSELETFFTPWHAVLYSGFLAVTLFVAATAVRNKLKGSPWIRSVPIGYGPTVIGILVFALGGVSDLLWHGLFGIEAHVEALISPPHVVLGLGGALMCAGPLRAAWLRSDSASQQWLARIPMVISLTLLLSIFGFFTMYAHPLGRPWPASGNEPSQSTFAVVSADPFIQGESPSSASIAHALGMAGMTLYTVVMMGTVLLALQRWRWKPPLGTFTILLSINALLLGFMRDQLVFVPGALLAGVAADAFIRRYAAVLPSHMFVRGFAFAFPVLYYVLYFATLTVVKGTWWSAHMIVGSILLTGLCGWLISYVSMPPASRLASSETRA